MTALAPSAAVRLTLASPIPLAPPVIKTTLPDSLLIGHSWVGSDRWSGRRLRSLAGSECGRRAADRTRPLKATQPPQRRVARARGRGVQHHVRPRSRTRVEWTGWSSTGSSPARSSHARRPAGAVCATPPWRSDARRCRRSCDRSRRRTSCHGNLRGDGCGRYWRDPQREHDMRSVIASLRGQREGLAVAGKASERWEVEGSCTGSEHVLTSVEVRRWPLLDQAAC